MYRSVDGTGIKLVFLAGRGSVAITRTTSGWDHLSISADHLPNEVEFRIIFIENTSFEKMTEDGIETADVSSLIEYFDLH